MKQLVNLARAVTLLGVLAVSLPAFGTVPQPICGNGFLEGEEKCDDGASGSACCSTSCEVNPGCGCCEGGKSVVTGGASACYLVDPKGCYGTFYMGGSCGPKGCIPVEVCGNGIVEGDEQCDDAYNPCCNSKTCQFRSHGAECYDDGNTCTVDACNGKGDCLHQLADPLPSQCGCCEQPAPSLDGRNVLLGACSITDSKACRGEFFADAACTPNGCEGAVCGNGILEEGEDCDPGGSDSTDCCNVDTCKFLQIGTTCSSDGEACTSDVCDAAGLCTHHPNNDPCEDGAYCTVNDVCSGGSCQPGSARDCGAGNTCSTASCNETADQCEVVPNLGQNGQPCNDNNACTNGTTCSGGTCGGGTTLSCDDNNTCTADSCNPMTGCVNTIAFESKACGSCEDGVDNDDDDTTDYEDCGCNLLCESFDYAVIGTRNTSRRTVYLGGQVEVGSRDITGGVGYTSRASVCAERQLLVIADSRVDGAVVARRNAKLGTGTETFFGFFAGFPAPANPVTPPAVITTTGIAPFVGPPTQCSDGVTACTMDSECPMGFVCNPLLMSDPANVFPAGHVDLTGMHEEYIDCGLAIQSLQADLDALLALTPTANLGVVTHSDGGPPIVVSGPGPHVLKVTRLRVRGKSILQIQGDPNSVIIFQVDRGFSVAQTGAIELIGGLRPDKVIWAIDRSGRAYIGSGEDADPMADGDAIFAGTVLAPNRNIVVGKQSYVSGALLGRKVQLNGQVTVAHYPFTGVAP